MRRGDHEPGLAALFLFQEKERFVRVAGDSSAAAKGSSAGLRKWVEWGMLHNHCECKEEARISFLENEFLVAGLNEYKVQMMRNLKMLKKKKDPKLIAVLYKPRRVRQN